jgi:SAM-dependent methyltransferase
VVYDRSLLADSFANLLDGLRPRTVLDCACGTGLPALDLRARGYSIDCSDADELMLEQFRTNARALAVSDQAWQLRWADLASLGRSYDLVMCRGNSLAYAESWEDGASAANREAIARHVDELAAAVAPGGWLLVDAPRALTMAEATYPAQTFRGSMVVVSERVTLGADHRVWEQRVCVGGDEASFVRRSSNLTAEGLTGIVLGAGFDCVVPVAVDGERPSYGVLLARKGA